MLGALERVGLLPSLSEQVGECVANLDALVLRLGPGSGAGGNPAKELASAIHGRVPVVWGGEGLGSVAAARWKTQFNENAKSPAFSSAMPELDHNEVVGWSSRTGEAFHVIALRHRNEHPDVAARFDLSLGIAAEAGAATAEVWAEGASLLSQLFSLVLHGDFASVYLALLRGVDPTPVEAIDRLKRSLAGR
jgi:glucose/mannose-6-phosphate isomerase